MSTFITSTGRFIKFGDFGLNNGTGRTVWYGEGIAEYISRRTCNANAESEAKKGSYPISTIFKNEYGVGQTRIYPWGYLAVRYMFEQQNATFFQMLEKFKKGEYPSYRTDMVDPWVSNKTYDGNFAAWLPNVASSGCVVDDTRPPSPLPPVDIDDVQGDDKPGFDACAAGRTPITGGELKAGVASCLADVSDSRQTQMSIHIDGVDADLEITLRHGSGNGDLYHRFDRRPTPAVNDHASAGPGNTEDIMVKSLKQGWNYIHVIANPSFSGATVLARFVEKSTPGQNKSPKALANGPYKGNVGQAIAFSSGGSNDVDGTITGYLWNFGDGNSSSVANPSHSYSKVGNYSVTLTVTDDKGATDNSVASVAVSAASTGNVVPIAEANGPYSSVVGNAISFSSGGSSDSDGSIASYNWNFGDGNSSTAANPSHSYASAGSYTVTLAVTDDKGATANDTATATVTAQPTPPPPANALPTAEANGPYSGTAGNAVSFSSSGSVDSDGSIAGYSWSFGDGSSSSAANPSHSYASAGTYTVTLTVTDDKGATASDTAQATITTASADGGGATNGGTVTTVSSSESGGSSASSPLLLSLLILVTTLLRRRMTG